ncbi:MULTISPECIES: PEP-CTERM sorting domain-containing protein [unclassified Oleiphilus]|uniref:PEP-CTERM sorting domain-containing protein n=1 Tax=unclassified Oleiphilus TaxID=2631174 RepID=UPI0007C35A26|nr:MULTISPECIES: PEP-CTERM sorting domain-containing protein [unclassified Oleiphilus]KZY63849.1 hypothetical protein A3738_01900 [Oleiphilus sp. HI0066]KZY69268.1 hypothetical protein A3739_09340 [Oleiphilus sp. HI0067]
MKLLKGLLAVSLLSLAAHANAGAIYATDIDWQNNGTIGGTNDRANPANALGSPDGQFTAIGLGGFAVFEFGETFTGPSSIWEVTFGCGNDCGHYPEKAQVWVGNNYNFGSHDFSDLSDFTHLGDITNTEANGGGSVLFDGTWTYLALVDISATISSKSTDGFDVDAISVQKVPEPQTFVLLGLGLIALRAARKAK